MRYELKSGLLGDAAPLSVALVAMVFAAGCSFHASAGGRSGPPPQYGNQPPPPHQGGPAPAAAPMPGNYGPSTTTPPPPGAPRYTLPNGETIPIITAPNAFGNGTAGGDALRGFVYFLQPGTQRLPDLGAMKPAGVLYTRSLDIPGRDFREGFPGIDSRSEWFAIRYEGTFNVNRAASYAFRLRTDDGSILWIDDNKVIDNDGLHAAGGGSRVVPLSVGTHRIRLDYFQGGVGQLQMQVFASEVNTPERIFTTSFL